LSVQEGARLGDGQGAVVHPTPQASHARRPAAPPKPGAAGMVQLLPARRVLADVWLCRPLRLLADRRLAPQTTRRTGLGNLAPPLPPPLGGPRRNDGAVPATSGAHRAVPLPRHSHPHTM